MKIRPTLRALSALRALAVPCALAAGLVACDGGGDGVSGSAGSSGSAGTSGSAGAAGTSAAGSAGAIGQAGTAGTVGAAGRGGVAGTAGATGAAGTTALAGRGGSGMAGVTGAAGTTAAAGRGGSGTAGTIGAAGRGGSGAAGSGGSAGGAGGCTPPAAGDLVGWASVSGSGVSTTTGGGNAAPMTVSSASQLSSAAAGTTARVIWVQGSLSGNITVGSNKTIVGVCGAQIRGHLELSGSVNVIIRNIAIVGYGVGDCALDPSFDSSVGCSSGNDAISVRENAHHIWIDHCDVSDGTDGNLDITNGANYVTVSWTKFRYSPRTDDGGSDSTGASGHRFSSLVGGSDSAPGDANALNVTWHHDWWADNVNQRQPRVRFGKNHLFNNLWTSSGDSYCVRAGIQAQILIENSVFSGVRNPQEFNSSSDQGTAYITATNNVYDSATGTRATGGGGTPFTTPPYAYTLDAASGVQSAVQSGAGPK